MANKVNLPKMPVANLTQPASGVLWTQPSTGAMHAARQLHKNLHKAGRKRTTLPGGTKLQPLFKNHTAPPHGTNSPFGPKVLPNIASAITDQDALIKHVMSGDLNYLPDASPSTVRVFLASNYDDMKEERNMLIKRAVPQIQDFCSKLGLHFQLVDLNWAVEQDMLDGDLTVRSVHQQEITDCQRLSLGPNFVALLGDKYGSAPLITEIPEAEFDILYNVATEHDMKEIDLLCTSYCKDTNACDPVYRIHVAHDDFKAVALRAVVQQCVNIANNEGKLTDEQRQKYFFSSIEGDVLQGIVETKDPRRHCLCYRREFQGFKSFMDTSGIADFFDVIENDDKTSLNIDLYETTVRMSDMVSKHLGAGNFKPYYISWCEEGMSVESAEFQKYLAKMCQDFVNDVTSMVSQQAEKLIKGSKKIENITMQEVLYQASICSKYCHNFQGQEQLLGAIQRFLRDPRVNNKPFVIYGESGSGKSAVMAKTAIEIKKWFSHKSVVVYRALGSTSDSASIFKAMISITSQICLAYGLDLPDINTDCSTLFKTLDTFRAVIAAVSSLHAFISPLYILLDGIHNLQPQDESMQAMWALRDLPSNVHIIGSIVPKIGHVDLVTGIVQLVSDNDCSVEIGKLTEEDAKELIKADFRDANRTLTSEQERSILGNFKQFNQPLLLKSTIALALEWGSYLKRSETGITVSAEEYLSRTLDELEELYGGLLIMSLVSYITTCPVGVQERELIDLLLADQDVEDEMYKFPNSVFDGLRYLPSYLLANVKFKLRHFLTTHVGEGKAVLAWSHRLFYAAAAQKYQVIYPGIDEHKITDDSTSYTLMLHETIANMYLKDYTRQTISAMDSKKDKKNSIPLTHPQPVNIHNIMKLERVPVSLRVMAPVEGVSRAKEAVLFNFEWILSKLKAKPVHHVLNDLLNVRIISNHVSQQGGDEKDENHDMDILFEFLQLAKHALNKEPDYLAAEMLARLPKFAASHEWIGKLLEGLERYLNERSNSMLVPVFPCFKEPQGLLRHTMVGPTHVLGFLQQGLTTVMFSQSSGVDIWLNSSGELVHRFSVNAEQKLDKVIPGNTSEFIMIGHYSHLNHKMELHVVSTETGVRLVTSIYPQNFETIALNQQDNLLVVSTSMDEGGSASQKCLLGVDVQTKEVLHTIPADDIHEEGITKLMFVPGAEDETYLLTIGSKRSKDLGFWNLKKECLEFKMLLNVYVEHVQVNGSTAICGSSRHGVLLFIDLNEGKLLKRIDESDLVDMQDMLVTREGQHVCVATAEMGINVYSREKAAVSKVIGERVETDDGKRIAPSKLCTDDEERYLVVGYENGMIVVYCCLTGQTVVKLIDDGHTQRVNSLMLSEDLMLFSAGQDCVAKMWNLGPTLHQFTTKIKGMESKIDGIQQFNEETNEITAAPLETEARLPGKRDNISDVIISHDGKLIITGSHDGPIKIWDIGTGAYIRSLETGCLYGVAKLYLACKGTLLMGHCKQPGVATANRLQAWRLSTGEALNIKSDSDVALLVYSSCLLPGGQKLLTVSPSADNRQAGMMFTLVDLFDLNCVTTLHCSILGSMDCMSLQFIGATLYADYKPTKRPVHTSTTASYAARLALSEAQLEKHDAIIAVLDYFPDDSTSYFFSIRLSGDKFEEINMDRSEPIHVDSRSPDCSVLLEGGRCITGTINGAILVWDSATQKRLDNLYDSDIYKESKSKGKKGRPAHAGSVTCLLLSDDKSILLSGGTEGQVKVWHLPSKTLIKTVHAHESPITCMSLSPNNEILVTGSHEPELQLHVLNPRATQTPTRFYTHSPKVCDAILSRDCSRVVVVINPQCPRFILLRTMHI